MLNTAWFLPQNRERIYLIGSLRGESRPEVFPIGESCQAIKDCSRERLSKTNTSPTIVTKVGDASVMTNPFVFSMRGGRKIKGGTKVEFRKDGNTNCITRADQDNLVLNGWEPLQAKRTEKAKKIRRENQKKGKDYAPFREKQFVRRSDNMTGTITAQSLNENLVTNLDCIRKLTPLECERLQGFPDHWTKYGIVNGEKKELSDYRRYHMLGNAVSVPVVRIVGQKILKNNIFNRNQKQLLGIPKRILFLRSKAFQIRFGMLKQNDQE